jgi:hypothetical protein
MIRYFLLFCLALLAACGTSTAPATGPAGKVIELKGEAQRDRGGEVAQLHVGDEVYAEDAIETREGTELVILLDRNGARWQIRGKGRHVVRESLAWKARKSDQGWHRDEGRTSSAGAHAEQQAGEGAETVVPEAASASAEPDVSPEGRSDGESLEEPTQGPSKKRTAIEKKAPPKPLGGLGDSGDPKISTGGHVTGGGERDDKGEDETATDRRGTQSRKIMRQHMAKLKRCLKGETPGTKKLSMTLRIFGGRAVDIAVSGVSPGAAACIEKVLVSLRFVGDVARQTYLFEIDVE